jgi:hypothetical protein
MDEETVIVLPQTEFNKEEWRDIALVFLPDITDEQYDKMWDDFIEMKRTHGIHLVEP